MQCCLPRFAKTSALCNSQTAAILRRPGCSMLSFRTVRTATKQRNSITPLFSFILGWLVEGESRIIPTGDKLKNPEVKQRNIFFHQIVQAESRMLQKTLYFLVAHTEVGWLECGPSRLACWEHLNLSSSWDRVYHEGCILLRHTSPQQSLGNEWHS